MRPARYFHARRGGPAGHRLPEPLDLPTIAVAESPAKALPGIGARLIGPLLVLSLLSVPFTWWLPLFVARVPFLWRHEVSIASGLAELWRLDLLLWSVVLLFSVLTPLAKGAALVWVWYRVPVDRARRQMDRLALLSKLAMAEVFLLAVMLVGLKGVGIGRVEVSWGLHLFIAAVLLSLIASSWAGAALLAGPATRPSPHRARETP